LISDTGGGELEPEHGRIVCVAQLFREALRHHLDDFVIELLVQLQTLPLHPPANDQLRHDFQRKL
jgi:hypothetical protein